ncbi:MAG TPA: hypothetical protein VNX02_17595 [Steroidobacteraceae bacterium]|jgi:hypothetical protein|nr:hypothetical protein [Steroidobacteraceae bacterium]
MPYPVAVSALALGLAAALTASAVPAPPGASGPTIVMPGGAPAPTNAPPAAAPRGCLPAGNGYLRATLRGALNLDIDWHNGELECDGGPRPDGSGIRLSFAGPKRADGHRLRMVFGVNTVREGRGARDLPTNLTLIVEGAQRLYTTRGEDHCTVDSLHQQRLPTPGSKPRTYRIVARGFCVAPASTLNDAEHILVSSFDFAGSAVYGDDAIR